jgi:hypothetical protein
MSAGPHGAQAKPSSAGGGAGFPLPGLEGDGFPLPGLGGGGFPPEGCLGVDGFVLGWVGVDGLSVEGLDDDGFPPDRLGVDGWLAVEVGVPGLIVDGWGGEAAGERDPPHPASKDIVTRRMTATLARFGRGQLRIAYPQGKKTTRVRTRRSATIMMTFGTQPSLCRRSQFTCDP